MSGLTKIDEYNRFFVDNYKYLLGFAKSIDVSNDYESLLHDSYVQGEQRIRLSGYSGNTFLNFIRVIIMNRYKRNYRDTKHTVELNTADYIANEYNENYSSEIEAKLQKEKYFEDQQKQYDYEMMYLNTMAYEYVNKYFSEKENMIFKTYYVLKHKHINYKILSDCTGYSITNVSKTIKKIKKSLKLNLLCYINTGLNVMELEDKIKRVEQTLAKPLNKNLGEYKATYILVFGQPFKTSCSCQLPRIRIVLQEWVNKNKTILNKKV